jgi:hypothetical protein
LYHKPRGLGSKTCLVASFLQADQTRSYPRKIFNGVPRQNSIRTKMGIDPRPGGRFGLGIQQKPETFRDPNRHEDVARLSAIIRRTQLSRSSSSVLRRNLYGRSSCGQIVAMMSAVCNAVPLPLMS